VHIAPHRESTKTNKKTAVPAKGTTVQITHNQNLTRPLFSYSVKVLSGRWTARCSTSREHSGPHFAILCKMRPTIYVQLTTGRFSDLRLTSRLLPIRQWRTVDGDPKRFLSRLETHICLLDFRAVSEQTRTAARPSRLLTAFPFGYPKAWLWDLHSGYFLFKEQQFAFVSDCAAAFKQKQEFLAWHSVPFWG